MLFRLNHGPESAFSCRRSLLVALAMSVVSAGMVPVLTSPALAEGDLLEDTTTTITETSTELLGDGDWVYSPSTTYLGDVASAIGAGAMWQKGYTGKGVGVALIDTGVVPVTGLTSGNVANGPDLSFESQYDETRYLDSFGHGTHMAGIIAGRDTTSSKGFRGIAPDATLVSVKVGGFAGAVDVSQVIAAIDWVVQHRNDDGRNIRVINLSYGTDGTQDYQADPLAHAVENAWRHGIVVVSSAGNRGTEQPYVDNPAADPYVIAVGADDMHGTSDAEDDTVPSFSSRGSDKRRVDLVAPGQSIASLRNPGSYVDENHPDAVVDDRFFKGSGTSQAAAVVSGSAALLLQQRPSLTPDQVKRLLMSTATDLENADAAGQGAGLINLTAAARASTPAGVQTWAPSTGLGSLEQARGNMHVSDGTEDLVGEQDIFGTPWNPSVWAPASAAGAAWSLGDWNGNVWSGSAWTGSSWTSVTWSSAPWTGRSWRGEDWGTWSGRSWRDGSWTGGDWSGRSWRGSSWSGGYWTSAGR